MSISFLDELNGGESSRISIFVGFNTKRVQQFNVYVEPTFWPNHMQYPPLEGHATS